MSDKKARIVVVGSINMDLVALAERLPRPGETIRASDLKTIPGGKGANQAVAAARLGGDVAIIARLGDDAFAPKLEETLAQYGVDTSHIRATPDCPCGVALIHVDPAGENSITIVAGANGHLTPDDIRASEAVIAGADALLLQLEVPLDTVAAALEIARAHGVRTILDPAPVPPGGLPEALFRVDVLSPNQTEAEMLTGVANDDEQAAEQLQKKGARQIVMKLGAEGALAFDADGTATRVAAFPVDPVDTTAAGDAFTAALAVGLAEGMSLAQATRFGCAAGALAASALGAQPSMPTRLETNRLLEK